jgi:hypothetical protein
MKLNKKGRARLHRSRRLKVSLQIVATGLDGTDGAPGGFCRHDVHDTGAPRSGT